MRSVATVSHAEAPSMCAAKAAKPLSSPLRSVAETKAVGKDGANLGAVDRRWEQKHAGLFGYGDPDKLPEVAVLRSLA